MRKFFRNSLTLLSISSLFTFLFAAESTVVLQNGIDGYNGCSDSYLESVGEAPVTTPQGTSNSLKIAE